VQVHRAVNLASPELEPYRRLGEHRWLKAQGLFVAEGRLVVERVVAAQGYRIRSIVVSPPALAALAEFGVPVAPGVPVYLCQGDELERLTGHDFHRGCLAVVERPAPLALDALLAFAQRVLVLDGVGNPDNVGGVFRNAAAFGVDAVLLGPTTGDPLYRKAIRTSMGAAFRVPFGQMSAETWPEAIAALSQSGRRLIALTPREPSVAIDDFAQGWSKGAAFALCVGAEGPGLDPWLEERADDRLRIPIQRSIDSLNVSVATAIALSRLTLV
jgi:tRNA G18 (ribose-2'-O)-methylase SpoU